MNRIISRLLIKNFLNKNIKSLVFLKQNQSFCSYQSQNKIDSESNELVKKIEKNSLNSYTIRTHTCGEINRNFLNQTVCLAGWIQYNRFNKFFVLRDKYGSIQLIINKKKFYKNFKKRILDYNFNLESVLVIKGIVRLRPEKDINEKNINGDIEIELEEIEYLNESNKQLTLNFNAVDSTSEDLCLKNRYIALRTETLQYNLQARCNFIHNIRKFLIDKLKFVEVETPTLFKNTPGGANEFIVPTRVKDKFYTLTQSPQQFKQLLMIGSIDKYFQIARCYRDELTRSDRQPEFTQLDIELSFTNSQLVQKLIEDLLNECWLKELKPIKTPFKIFTYSEIMEKYGIDKPDLRLSLNIKKHSGQCHQQSVEALSLKIKKGKFLNETNMKKIKDMILEKLNHHHTTNNFQCYLMDYKYEEENNYEKINPKCVNLDLQKSFDNTFENIKKSISLNEDDKLLFLIGDSQKIFDIFGKIRNSIIPYILQDKSISIENDLDPEEYSFLWVVDFPLFIEKDGKIESHHHPFTAPVKEHETLLYEDPLKVLGQHYDLVLNGNEIGGGSIRIHNHEMQKYVFNNILKSEISQMNFFFEALDSGCPQHGGIALGLDRLMSIMLNTNSIRDVIAFPKTTGGRDLMSDSPSGLLKETKAFYNL